MLKANTVSFAYDTEPVLEDISFEIPKGGYLALLGESGSGKSTLLKAIYGLLHLNQGEITWENRKVLGPNYSLIPGEKYMKFVSQDLDLMPFTTVVENISEYLPAINQETHELRVAELLDVIQMADYARSKIRDLSGGQKQRVAIARALAQEPEVLLMDEPFGSIDQFKKNTLRQSLFPYLKDQGITVITATHDPDDVLPFAWMAMVIKDGKMVDFGPMQQMYNSPKDLYVASLFGDACSIPLYLLQPDYFLDTPIVVYPHELSVTTNSTLAVTVQDNFFKGGHYLIRAVHETDLPVLFHHPKPILPGTKVALKIAAETLWQRIGLHHG